MLSTGVIIFKIFSSKAAALPATRATAPPPNRYPKRKVEQGPVTRRNGSADAYNSEDWNLMIHIMVILMVEIYGIRLDVVDVIKNPVLKWNKTVNNCIVTFNDLQLWYKINKFKYMLFVKKTIYINSNNPKVW